MTLIKGRYETKEKIGDGGMGVVFRTSDLEMPQSDVALKTIKELVDPRQTELFLRECGVLRELKHPNVIDLYDFGISKENGEEKPFYVMPLLPGVTLDKLIRTQSAKLTPERVVDIITQAAKGLQAAHDLKLIHRDIKPSNIFVLPDDSVKLIDFGVVHLADHRTRTSLMGTPSYMAPEQLELAPVTEKSDVFSLAVVCYEALTKRRPFNGNTLTEIREEILHTMPPPASELNPAVSLALSQVLHAAMAKQPWNRTSSAAQFADELQKALHGQPIERFDPSRIEPRMVRAQKALETSQYEFAAEILTELEAEGHIDPSIRSLRRQIDQALRARDVKQKLESAQHRFAESEYQLALQKVEEVLRLDPQNDEALALKKEIDAKHRDNQIENWFKLASDHLQNYSFKPARDALQNVLRLRPTDTHAFQMLHDVDRRENEYQRQHREKEQVYSAAMEDWHRGEVTGAVMKLERVLELDRRAPDTSSAKALSYQNLYNQVRSEHDGIKNAYEEARRLLSQNDFYGAAGICARYIEKYPEHALFQALRFDISEQQRQHVSAYIVKIDREVEAEADLNRKVAILSEARDQFPDEAHFRERLEKVTQRRDHIAQMIEKIHNLEDRGRYADALGKLDILRMIYPQYPGLELEVDRIKKRRDRQARADEKARWLNQIDQSVNKGDFTHSLTLLKSALVDFPEDAELIALERQANDGQNRSQEAARVFENAQSTVAQGDLKAGIDGLWQAHLLDEHNPLILAVLVETLLKRASTEMDRDLTLSDELIRQAIELDHGNTQAKSLQQMALDRRKESAINLILSGSREQQAAGDINGALESVEKGLLAHGSEPRLLARKEVLQKLMETATRSDVKERDLAELHILQDRMKSVNDQVTMISIMDMSRAIAGKHPGDPQFESLLKASEGVWDAAKEDRRVSELETMQFEPAAAAKGAGAVPPVIAKPDSVQEAPSEAPDSVQVEPVRSRSSKTKVLIGAGVAAAILLVVVLLKILHVNSPAKPLGPFETEASLTATIPGAHILVNDEDKGVAPLKLTLKEGTYRINAALDGYGSEGDSTLTIGRNDTSGHSVEIALKPLPPLFRLLTDIKNVKEVQLDGLALTMDATGIQPAEIANGSHTLKIVNARGDATTIEFEMAEAMPPKVTKFSGSRNTVMAVATLMANGQIYANADSLKASFNGSQEQDVTETGLKLEGLKAGSNNLLLREAGKAEPRETTIDVTRNPGLIVMVGTPNVGMLRVSEANNVEATVRVEPVDKSSKPVTMALKNGSATFQLEPKDYIVTLTANGFETDSVNPVKVTRDKMEPITRTLKPLVTTATLEIRGGTPDAEVWIDGRSQGTLTSNGDFTSTQISPAKHRIELRKDGFEPRTVSEADFTAGGKVSVSGAAAALTAFGSLTFDVTPANSEITYMAAGETTGHKAKPGDKVPLKQGRYIISITAGNYVARANEAYNVTPGQPTVVKVDLKSNVGAAAPVADTPTASPAATPKPKDKDILTGMKSARDNNAIQCSASYCLSREKTAGTYAFKVKLSGGALFTGKKASWVVDYLDGKNYTEFEIDDKNIKYTVTKNGKKQDSKSSPHQLTGSDGFYDVTVAVGTGSKFVVVSSGKGGKSLISAPLDDAASGSFGFEKDVTVTDFSFTPAK